MYQAVLVFHIILSLSIIGLVLLQRGKGADMGAGFGGGNSQGVFGGSGSGSFLTLTTSWLAAGFFASCLVLSYLAAHMLEAQSAEYLPAVPVAAAPAASVAPAGSLPAVPATEVLSERELK